MDTNEDIEQIDAVEILRMFAGIAALTSSIIGLTIWAVPEVERIIRVLAFTFGVGMGLIGLYLVIEAFAEFDNNPKGETTG